MVGGGASVVLDLSAQRTMLECLLLFLNLYSCSHPQNLILKLENMVSQLVILEGGGERGEKASVGGRARGGCSSGALRSSQDFLGKLPTVPLSPPPLAPSASQPSRPL